MSSERMREIRRRQRRRALRANAIKIGMIQAVIILVVSITALTNMDSKAEQITARPDALVEHESIEVSNTNYEPNEIDYQVTTKASEVSTEVEVEHYPEFTYSKDWDADDAYLLAKIAMAEAEGENIQTKTLVILSVLNRVWSEDFPNTIEEVIKEEHNGVYQYSPLAEGGRWYTTEPNEDCFEAVQIVMEAKYDYSGGALYFESCEGESWHSKNLTFLYESGAIKFYK